MSIGFNGNHIFVYSKPVDMRKSFDGLLALVRHELKQDPFSGCLCAFVNRKGNVLKAVWWDRTGYCLFAKRLERGRFVTRGCDEAVEWDERKFILLLDGIFVARKY